MAGIQAGASADSGWEGVARFEVTFDSCFWFWTSCPHPWMERLEEVALVPVVVDHHRQWTDHPIMELHGAYCTNFSEQQLFQAAITNPT